MSISPESWAGREYAPTAPYEVTLGKIAEFTAALGHPAHDSPPEEAPPTFGAVVANPAWDALFTDRELDLRLDHIVHGDQRFTFQRPLRAGDVVTATLRIDKVRARAGAEIISSAVTVHDAAGEPVLTADATFVHTR